MQGPEAPLLPLAYAPAWVAASVLLVAAVVYGSLSVGVQLPGPGQFDKLQHAVAYAFLAVWFTGIVARGNFWKVALALASLGLALEFLQHVMQIGRYGDPWDMAANAVGIGVGVALGAWRTGGWALKVEQWLSLN